MLNFISRAFNSWEEDPVTGIITKKSDTDRLKNEIDYYLLLPEELRIFFPRVIKFDTVNKNWFSLERYGYPDVGKILTKKTNVEMDWDKFFEHLYKILLIWKSHTPFSTAISEVVDNTDCVAMYITKTETEVKAFKNQDRWPEVFLSDEIIINGQKYKSFDVIWPDIREYLTKSVIPSYNPCIIHGDFCLPNILYNDSKIVKFIDPRGSFGKLKIHGDQRYDIAKLSHSVNGGYEFLNNGLFSVSKRKDKVNEWEYKLIGSLEEKNKAKEAFEKVFIGSLANKKEIYLIEGLIFVGAAARHYENVDRQLALFLVGLERLNIAMSL